MELGIVARPNEERATALAAELVESLERDAVDVAVDPETAAAVGVEGTPIEEMAGYDLVVSVGGDGTFLHAARRIGGTPVMGVNLGEVGFLNAVGPGEAVERVREEVAHVREAGAPRFREVPRLVARGERWRLPPAMNEIAIQGPHRGHGGGLDATVRIDGSEFASGRADGVLVATPTGSTAYNLSEGGPLVHPDVDALVVSVPCAREPMPPVVVDPDQDIVVEVSGADRAAAASDGRRRWIDPPVEIGIGLAETPARIAGPRSDFFRAIEKLERPIRRSSDEPPNEKA